MSLRTFIQQSGLTGTAQEITDALNAKTVSVSRTENITSAGLVIELGPEVATQALIALETVMNDPGNLLAPLLRSQYHKLNSTGLDFSHPLTRQMIDQLQAAGAFSAELAAAIKAIGMRQISPYEQYAGEGQVVTLQQVEEALQEPVVNGQRLLFSANVSADQVIYSLAVQQLAGSEIVSTQAFSSVGGRSSGNAAADTLFAEVSAAISRYLGA